MQLSNNPRAPADHREPLQVAQDPRPLLSMFLGGDRSLCLQLVEHHQPPLDGQLQLRRPADLCPLAEWTRFELLDGIPNRKPGDRARDLEQPMPQLRP